jgi:hypothetical protein
VLANVEPVEFLQAISLLHTKAVRDKAEADGKEPPAISANRNSLLQLPLSAYQLYADRVERGYLTAARFLHWLKIFRARDLPYQTQLVPLAAILAELGGKWENDAIRQRLSQWYWCGLFGELYGSAVESRFALDIRDLGRWLNGGPLPRSSGRISARSVCARYAPAFLPHIRAYTLCLCGPALRISDRANPSIKLYFSTRAWTSTTSSPRLGARRMA